MGGVVRSVWVGVAEGVADGVASGVAEGVVWMGTGCWWQRSIAELLGRCCEGVGVGIAGSI